MDSKLDADWERLYLVHAYRAAGRYREAFTELEILRASVAANGRRALEVDIPQLRGELLLGSNPLKKAEGEEAFLEAIEIARSQWAKSMELIATISLARLLAEQGRRYEARKMLGEIYNWFTEGFDTADLKDAKALLEELGG